MTAAGIAAVGPKRYAPALLLVGVILMGRAFRSGMVRVSKDRGRMADVIHGFLQATAELQTNRQRLIASYLVGVLIDLVVPSLVDEFRTA